MIKLSESRDSVFNIFSKYSYLWGIHCGSGLPKRHSDNLPASARDAGSIPESGRSPGEEDARALQYSCRENPMDGGAWWATVHGVAENRTRLSDFTFTFTMNLKVSA